MKSLYLYTASVTSCVLLLSACGSSGPADSDIIAAIEDKYHIGENRVLSLAYAFLAMAGVQYGGGVMLNECSFDIDSKTVDEIQGDDTFYNVTGNVSCTGYKYKSGPFGPQPNGPFEFDSRSFVANIKVNTSGKVMAENLRRPE